MKPVFIGELNPYGMNPEYALWPDPRNAAGDRLRRLILGVRRSTYHEYAKYNLCTGKWSMPAARAMAQHLRMKHGDDVLVLLGRKVVAAFGLEGLEAFSAPRGRRRVILPHPSGRNRTWNEPGAFLRARATLLSVCPDLPLGEIFPGELDS